MTEAPPDFLSRSVARFVSFLRTTGEMTILAFQTFRQVFKRPFEAKEFISQLYVVMNQSLSITLITATFTGGVLALQTAYGLSRFGAKEFVANVVSLSIIRELGPVLTALMVGGRVGSGMTAELGSMQVTEQIDAIRALGANPVRKLVVPRMLALMIGLPLLTSMANIVGTLSGMAISAVEPTLQIEPRDYLDEVQRVVRVEDFLSGMIKPVFFGFLIALVACYQGFKTQGGTEGVGQATTRTVVIAAILILINDYFLTKLVILLFPIAQ